MSSVYLVFFSDLTPSSKATRNRDGLHPPCRAAQLIYHSFKEKCDFHYFAEGLIVVAQTLLVLPLWKPESRTAASLQEVSHKSQHRRGDPRNLFFLRQGIK